MAPFEDNTSFYIGSVRELISTGCDAHLRFLQLLFGSSIFDEPSTMIMVHRLQDPYIRLFAEKDKEHVTTSPGCSLVKKGSTGYGRILDPCRIDLNLIRNWKSDCDNLHGNKCTRRFNMTSLAPASPSWLVDVNRKCIVPARPGMSYVALSYVWENSGQLRALKDNVQKLQKEGALDSSDQGFTAPRTIQDAIGVAILLQEAFLWVDALCIVQDDDSTKQDQLNNMVAIFAEARVTIIAKDGHDSSFGLPGLSRSLSRNLCQNVFKLDDNSEAVVHPWTAYQAPTPWDSRGWTFQEAIFSPRRLIFHGKTIRWECNLAIWREDLDFNSFVDSTDEDDDTVFSASLLFESLRPNLGLYGQLHSVYNKRQLTYSADALDAFAGITTTLSHVFEGGFYYGLPVMFFGIALLLHRTPNMWASPL